MIWLIFALAIVPAVVVHVIDLRRPYPIIIRILLLLLGVSTSIVIASILALYLRYPNIMIGSMVVLVVIILAFPYLLSKYDVDYITMRTPIHIVKETIGMSILMIGSLVTIVHFFPALSTVLTILLWVGSSGCLIVIRYWLSHHLHLPFWFYMVSLIGISALLYKQDDFVTLLFDELEEMPVVNQQEFVKLSETPNLDGDGFTDRFIRDGWMIHTNEEYLAFTNLTTGEYHTQALTTEIVEYENYIALVPYNQNLYAVTRTGLFVIQDQEAIELYQYQRNENEDYIRDYYSALILTETGLLYETQDALYDVNLDNHQLTLSTSVSTTPNGFVPVNIMQGVYYVKQTEEDHYTGYYTSSGTNLDPSQEWNTNDIIVIYANLHEQRMPQYSWMPYIDYPFGSVTIEQVHNDIERLYKRDREHVTIMYITQDVAFDKYNLAKGDSVQELIPGYLQFTVFDDETGEFYLFTTDDMTYWNGTNNSSLSVYQYQATSPRFQRSYGVLFHPTIVLTLVLGVIPTTYRTKKESNKSPS